MHYEDENINTQQPKDAVEPQAEKAHAMLRLLKVGGLEKLTADEFRARTQEFGKLYLNYGAQLISDPQYQAASDTAKREALAALNRRIKSALGDDDEQIQPGKLSAPALFESLERAAGRKRQREQKRGR
jgi:hypothetical protein